MIRGESVTRQTLKAGVLGVVAFVVLSWGGSLRADTNLSEPSAGAAQDAAARPVPALEATQAEAAPQPAPAVSQPTPAETHAEPANAEGLTYVGSETCSACHEPVWNALQHTPHGKKGFADLSAHGCETCHGPGSLHVENPDIVENRPRFEKKSVDERSATCRTCHDGAITMLWNGSPHNEHGLSCDSCHTIHEAHSDQAQLKTTTINETCVSCHLNVRAEMWKTSHHPLREGKMSCVDCHNPHGSTTPGMLKEASLNDTCYQCHTEKRGPFLWEHPPVREDCSTCHAPHGSNHIKLQKTSVPFLCQECHLNTRHPGSMYDGLKLPTLENDQVNTGASNRLFNRACLDCHSAIHGSNHPSGPYLGR